MDEEDELCTQFRNATKLRSKNDYYDPTTFQLYLGDDGGVFSSQQIYKNTFIGEIYGVPEYAHIITHEEYIIISDGFVLDTSIIPLPRSILTCLRCEWESEKTGNCIIRMEINEETHESRFYAWTTERIDEGEEIVYFK